MQQYPPSHNEPIPQPGMGQYPPQPPYYAPAQPQKKPGCNIPILIGAVALVVVSTFACLLVFSAVSAPLGNAMVPATASLHTTATADLQVGDTAIGTTWEVTVRSVKTSLGDTYSKPDPNAQFILVDVSMKNVSTQVQNVSSVLDFTLRDRTGQAASIAILSSAPASPEGRVSPGGTIRGTLLYQDSRTMQTFILDFADITSGDTAAWELHV